MKKSSLNYYAFVNPKQSPGVFNKIKATVKAANNLGLTSNYFIYENTIRGGYLFTKDLLNCDSDYVLIRFVDKILPILFLVLLKLRSRGKIIIIDIPTPRIIALKEIALSERSYLYRTYRTSLSIFLGNWLIAPSHKVIQYSDESFWFKIGIRNKIIKMGNGIVIDDQTPIIESVWPDKELRLIGVAQLEAWHGYDRLIKAIASKDLDNLDYKVSFTIVGEGPELKNLKQLVAKLGVQDRVEFTGMLIGEQLNDVFKNKHIGVSSLASFRKGINEASDLKTREYMARGLPVLGVGSDPDFPEHSIFRFKIPNDNSTETIVDFIRNIGDMKLPDSHAVRKYADEKLSYEKKLSNLLQLNNI